jgi:virulence-associated protein VapD
MFWKSTKRKMADTIGLFNGHYIDVKVFYVMSFDAIPCINFVGELDNTKAFSFINEAFGAELKFVYQHAYFDHTEGSVFFNNTIFVLSEKRIVELGHNYCQILFSADHYTWASKLMKDVSAFKIQNEPSIGFIRKANVN